MTELTDALKSISDSDTKVDLAIAANNIKHMTEGLNRLTNNVNKINERVSTNEKRLDIIEKSAKIIKEKRATFWNVIQKNWRGIIWVTILLAGLFAAEFEIVRQATLK